jgi:hypothetical protein
MLSPGLTSFWERKSKERKDMATIQKRVNGSGKVTFRVQVRRKGQPAAVCLPARSGYPLEGDP